MWESYRAERGIDLPDHRHIVLHDAIAHAIWVLHVDASRENPNFALSGTPELALVRLAEATAAVMSSRRMHVPAAPTALG